MRTKVKQWQWPYILDKLGIRYFDNGELTQGKTRVFDYYKIDKIRPAQKRALLRLHPDVKFMKSASQYAPELTSGLICIPKAGFYRLNKETNL